MPQLFTALQISLLDKIKDWLCLPNNTIVAKHFTHVYFVLIISQTLTICAIKTLHTQVSHTIIIFHCATIEYLHWKNGQSSQHQNT